MHAHTNVTAKLPERHHRELKARFWTVFDEAASVAEARRGLEALVGDYRCETSALSLIWAVLELSSRGWRGVLMTPRTVAEIERLRRGQVVDTGVRPRTADEDVVAA